jgi:hypothetical protein
MIRFSTGLRNNLAGALGLAASLERGVIEIRSGTQPASADNAATGVLLGTMTLASGPFTPGTATNGLTWGAAAGGSVSKTGVWSFVGIANGTAGHFRFKANAVDDGSASTTAVRMDGSCGTSGADLLLSNVNITVGAPVTCDVFTYTQPAQ